MGNFFTRLESVGLSRRILLHVDFSCTFIDLLVSLVGVFGTTVCVSLEASKVPRTLRARSGNITLPSNLEIRGKS
jgi:arginine exporter protein ArgO